MHDFQPSLQRFLEEGSWSKQICFFEGRSPYPAGSDAGGSASWPRAPLPRPLSPLILEAFSGISVDATDAWRSTSWRTFMSMVVIEAPMLNVSPTEMRLWRRVMRRPWYLRA